MKTCAKSNLFGGGLLLALAVGVFAVIQAYFLPKVLDTSRVVPTIQNSKAYTQYVHKPKEGMLKLFEALDHFKNKGFKVIYDGHEYDVNLAMGKAKQFINKHYKNEELENWVKLNLYRSQASGEIIYLKYPTGQLRPLRDVIIEHLQTLSPLAKRIS